MDRFRAAFETAYEPGELLAIAYRDGAETGRDLLRSATGPVLLGLGSADPATEERFDALERRTYDGRALAVVRPTGPGKIRLLASAPECAPAEIVIDVLEQRA